MAASGIGSGAAGPWYRVQAITADGRRGASAEQDYASVLPAVLNAALQRRPFVAGWLSRGGGAPLELITNAGPLPEPAQRDGLRPGWLQARLEDWPQPRPELPGVAQVRTPGMVIQAGQAARVMQPGDTGAATDPDLIIESSRIELHEAERGTADPGSAPAAAELASTPAAAAPDTPLRAGEHVPIEPAGLAEPKQLLFPWGRAACR